MFTRKMGKNYMPALDVIRIKSYTLISQRSCKCLEEFQARLDLGLEQLV